MTTANSYVSLVSLLNARNDNKDINACLSPNSVHFFAESTMVQGCNMGWDWELIFALPQKQVKRATQFANGIAQGLISKIDKTYARSLIAMKAAGDYALTTDALVCITANKHSDAINTRGVTLGQVNAVQAGNHSIRTTPTKTSGSTGRNGLFQITGMTFAAPVRNHEVMLNTEHPAVIAFFDLVNKSTTAQIDAVFEGKIE